jgi:hypothetical protein
MSFYVACDSVEQSAILVNMIARVQVHGKARESTGKRECRRVKSKKHVAEIER